MRNGKHKRPLALLLCAALLFGQMGATAYAEGGPPDAGNLCEHHKAHDAACGYVEAVAGRDCEHKHGAECYTDELICGMDEGAEQTASGSDAGHTHGQECHALDCPHERGEHDEACGYAEAVAGTPCGYVCDECGKADKDSGTASGNTPAPVVPGTGEPEDAGTITVTAFDKLDGAVKYAPLHTTWDDLSLPATLGASGYTVADDTQAAPEPEAISIEGVTWEVFEKDGSPAAYEEGRPTPCIYWLRAVLPEGYALDEGVPLPEIELRYGMASRNNVDEYNTVDLLAFKSILTTHPNLLSDGVTLDDPASWKTAGVGWKNGRIFSLQIQYRELEGALDVSGLTALTYLHCSGNKLTQLNVANLSELDTLYCNENQLESLDVSGTALIKLECYGNKLTSLTGVTNLSSLKELLCYSNQLKTLDVSGTALTQLSCQNNLLTELKGVSGLTNLKVLSCSVNSLKKLDVSNTALTNLYCYTNQLTEITGIESLSTLKILDCKENKLETLDVSNTALTSLDCNKNELSDLKVAGLSNLTSLTCHNNKLKTLNVSRTALTHLACSYNGITELVGLPSLTEIEILLCNKNELKTLDISTLTKLSVFLCQDNPYQSFKTANGELTISVSNGGKVIMADFYNNQVTLNAIPDIGYVFTGWGVEGGAANRYTFTLTGNKAIMATFASVVDISAISGVTAPVRGQTPVTSITATEQYTGTVTWNPNHSTFAADTAYTATITLSPKPGYTLQGVTANFFTVAGATATNDANSGTVTAVFPKTEKAPVTIKSIPGVTAPVTGIAPVTAIEATEQYTGTVTWNPNHSAFAADTEYTATITLSPKPGYTLQGVGKDFFTVVGATATNDANSGTVTAVFPKTAQNGGNGGNNGGSDSSNDSSTNRNYIITIPQPPKPDNPVLAVIELPVTVGGGTATGKANDGDTAAAIAEAGKNAGAKYNGMAVQYDAKTSKTYGGFSIVFQRATLDRLIAAKVKYVTLNTGIVDLTFDLAALQEIAAKSSGDITLTATRETGLAGDALAAVGTRPAYRLAVGYTGKDGKAATVQSFGAGRVIVGLAYKPSTTEQAGGLYLVHSKDGKGAEWLYQSSYDRNSRNVIASTGHFSLFGVGHRPAPAFTDTAGHWAKSDIDFVASRGLFAGTSDTTFTPGGAMTRGMFVVALGRLAGIDPAAYPSSSRFTDVSATAYYAPFVEWAAGKGIVSGTGAATFAPDRAVTREEMALIMQRYAQRLGYTLPIAREAESFADDNKISSGMKDAVQAVQQAGIMSGKGGHLFAPKDTATRAEAAAVLRRFVEIVIDRATAGGWAQNDAGRWLYYEDAKPVTGWKQIESKWYYFDTAGLMECGGWKEINGKWYYFYPDGAMAANTTIDGHQIGPDGKRKDEQ